MTLSKRPQTDGCRQHKSKHTYRTKLIAFVKNQPWHKINRKTLTNACKHTCGCVPYVKPHPEPSNKTQHLHPNIRHTLTSRQHSKMHLHTLKNMQIHTLKTDIDSHAYLMPLEKGVGERLSAWKWGKALVAVATETCRICASEK